MQQHRLAVRTFLAHLTIGLPLGRHFALAISALLALALLPLTNQLDFLLDLLILILVSSAGQFITKIHMLL